MNVDCFLQVVRWFGRQFHKVGPTTAKDVSNRLLMAWLQFLGRDGIMACKPSLDSDRNCTFRSLGIFSWRIFHILRIINRSLRLCRDIRPSFLSLSQYVSRRHPLMLLVKLRCISSMASMSDIFEGCHIGQQYSIVLRIRDLYKVNIVSLSLVLKTLSAQADTDLPFFKIDWI